MATELKALISSVNEDVGKITEDFYSLNSRAIASQRTLESECDQKERCSTCRDCMQLKIYRDLVRYQGELKIRSNLRLVTRI